MTPYGTRSAALWLLTRLVSDEALVGDIVERANERTSTLWFWRQAASAILLEVYTGLRDHWGSVLRASFTGAVTYWAFRQFVSFTGAMNAIQDDLQFALTRADGTWSSDAAGYFMVWFSAYLRHVPYVLLLYGICGWMIGRFYRRRWLAMVTPFAALVLTLSTTGVFWTWRGYHAKWGSYPGIMWAWTLTDLCLPVLAVFSGALFAQLQRAAESTDHLTSPVPVRSSR